MNADNYQKTDYLKTLGASIQERSQYDVSFMDKCNDYEYVIQFSDFELNDTLEEIKNRADIYSCCGDILDRDLMICPTCKEHC